MKTQENESYSIKRKYPFNNKNIRFDEFFPHIEDTLIKGVTRKVYPLKKPTKMNHYLCKRKYFCHYVYTFFYIDWLYRPEKISRKINIRLKLKMSVSVHGIVLILSVLRKKCLFKMSQ